MQDARELGFRLAALRFRGQQVLLVARELRDPA
jgi:hypothetical protein